MAGSARKKRRGNDGEAKTKKTSPYFNFCNLNRENVKKSHPNIPVSRALSVVWNSLSDAEKAAYNDPVPSDHTQAQHQELSHNTAADHSGDDDGGDENEQQCGEVAFEFPQARVKRIMKLDRDIRLVNGEVAAAVACATQLFLECLSECAFRVAVEKKHKSIRLQDVTEAVKRHSRFYDFLEGSLSDIGQERGEESDEECRENVSKTTASAPAPPPGNRSITDFFGSGNG